MGKYLFYDVDGTLVGNSQHITVRNKHALSEARAQGHRVSLCTGRAYLSALLGLDDLETDGMITHAGGIVSVGGQILYEHDIAPDLLHRMLHLILMKGNMLYTKSVFLLQKEPILKIFRMNCPNIFISTTSSETAIILMVN